MADHANRYIDKLDASRTKEAGPLIRSHVLDLVVMAVTLYIASMIANSFC